MKQQINIALINEPFCPQKLIDALKLNTNLKHYFSIKVRHYTLEKHTLLVMCEFEKYFSKIEIPINIKLFRLFLSLHDIGKSIAYLKGNISLQHQYSISIIQSIQEFLPINEAELILFLSFVKSDILGKYMQKNILIDFAKQQILLLVNEIKVLNLRDYFRLLTIYYQVDVGSYTKDAGGISYLEKIFEYENESKKFDNSKKILKFSPDFHKRYEELETKIYNE